MAALKSSPVPVNELLGISKTWSIASPGRQQVMAITIKYF